MFPWAEIVTEPTLPPRYATSYSVTAATKLNLLDAGATWVVTRPEVDLDILLFQPLFVRTRRSSAP
jgi:hypothetical protein